jgi:hypothetical protein
VYHYANSILLQLQLATRKIRRKSRKRVAIKVLVKLQLEGYRVAIRVLKIIKKNMFRVATEVLDELQLK